MATPRKNQTTGQDVSLDLVGPDGETSAGKQAPAPVESAPSVAPVEPPEPVTAEDIRAEKLNELLNADTAEADKPTAEELGYDPASTPLDFGGRTTCVVLFHSWRAIDEGTYKEAPKGSLVNVRAEDADRGEALGGLKRVDV